MKLVWIAGGIAAVVCVASLVPGPYASAAESSGGPLLQTAHLSSTAVVTLQRACGNCHSNQTEWPWYSRVAPMSWMVRKDVSEGRKFLNFSAWPEYGPEGQSQLLALAATSIKDTTMPPQRYLLLHAEAKLSEQEKSQLIAALEQESARASNAKP